MSRQYARFCLVLISYLNTLHGAIMPLRSLNPSTSTYKPSTLILPPGFDSQQVPRQPMLYPYAVSRSDIPERPKLKNILSTTPDWIPVALNGKSDLTLKPIFYSTTPTYPAPALEDHISYNELKYSSASYKEGPVFESIVYGTWKPNPPLQPVKVTNSTKKQQHQQEKPLLHATKNNTNGSNFNEDFAAYDEIYHNKTISRQHGGFIGNIQHRPIKNDKQIILSSPLTPTNHKSQEFTEKNSELKLQRKIRKHGRRKIRPNISSTEQTAIERSFNKEETTTITTKENIQHQKISIKFEATDPKLMEVSKQINESLEIKYNHKQSSPHSIDVTTKNDNDEYIDNDEFSTTTAKELSTNETQTDDDVFRNISATRRSWPTDFMEELLTTAYANFESMNKSDELNIDRETDPSKTHLALSALNIPPSLWPQLPGNITKLGTPYQAESSAEESAFCVPITVREHNIFNARQLIYIERVFCFPMPLSTTTFANNGKLLERTVTSTSTLRTFTIAKVQNFNNVIDSNSRISNAINSFKPHFYLLTSILVLYFKFIV